MNRGPAVPSLRVSRTALGSLALKCPQDFILPLAYQNFVTQCMVSERGHCGPRHELGC